MATKTPFESFNPQEVMDQSQAVWQSWQDQMNNLIKSAGTSGASNPFTAKPNPFGGGGANPFGGGANPFGVGPNPFAAWNVGNPLSGGFANANPFGQSNTFGFSGYGMPFQTSNPFGDAFSQMNTQGTEWMGKMMALSQQFADKTPTSKEVRESWESMMGGAGGAGAFNDVFGVLQNAGQQDFTQWLEQVQPLLQAFRMQPDASVDTPAFGWMREHQERWQQMAKWMQDYQEATVAFSTLLGELNQDAMNTFETLLDERASGDSKIDSARALFDVWVDAAENAYEKTALSPKYREAYGNLVNSQMRVRLAVQNEIERVTALIGIPGRSEIDAAYRKLTQLDREVRRLRNALLEQIGIDTEFMVDQASDLADSWADAVAPQKSQRRAAKKASKKAAKKVAKKATKKVAKKVVKKAAKKAAKKVAKAATKKVAKKVTKSAKGRKR